MDKRGEKVAQQVVFDCSFFFLVSGIPSELKVHFLSLNWELSSNYARMLAVKQEFLANILVDTARLSQF